MPYCCSRLVVIIMMVKVLEGQPITITLTINEMKLIEYWLGKEEMTEGIIPKKSTKFS
jgi:hypothetical protein